MMKTNNDAAVIPAITYTEILCYAIEYLEDVLQEANECIKGKPGCEEMFTFFCNRYQPKLEALKTLYKIETGTEYEVTE